MLRKLLFLKAFLQCKKITNIDYVILTLVTRSIQIDELKFLLIKNYNLYQLYKRH